jgi:hypothetical protein
MKSPNKVFTAETQRDCAPTNLKNRSFPSYRRKPVSNLASFALVKDYAEPVFATTTQPGFRLSPE